MTITDEEWRQYMAESTKRQRESLAQVRARKDAILAERQEMERLGLIRQQTFNMPIACYGRGALELMEKEATEARKRYLELHGAEAIKQQFPRTFKEFWPGI